MRGHRVFQGQINEPCRKEGRADFENTPPVEARRRAHLASSKQVAALNGLEHVGGDVGLGRKVSLCEGLLHFLHVNKAQSPFFSCGGEEEPRGQCEAGKAVLLLLPSSHAGPRRWTDFHRSCVHGSGPSLRTTMKNIWPLGQDSGMKKKICQCKIRGHEPDF